MCCGNYFSYFTFLVMKYVLAVLVFCLAATHAQSPDGMYQNKVLYIYVVLVKQPFSSTASELHCTAGSKVRLQ